MTPQFLMAGYLATFDEEAKRMRYVPTPEKAEELRRKRLARAPGCIRVKA